ncbi:MAG TPA: phage portal protein, partial [Candidatus Colwellbacteria bacterium]|nr:phage portal protein [Candidatus Colwellbacteria bacterium]
MKFKFLNRLGDALKAFSGFSGRLPFSLAGWSTSLRRPGRGVDVDPMGNYAGWVYAALSKRAKRIAAIQLRLFELNRSQDVEEIFDHELISLLYRANPIQSKYQFFYTIEMMIGIFGSSPVFKDRAGGKKIMYLWPLRPDLLKAIPDAQGGISSYEYRVDGRLQKFAASDIILNNEPNPQNLLSGFSALSAAGLEIDADLQAALWNKYLLENFSEPGGVLTTEQAIDDKSFERLKSEWNKRHAGPTNAGRWALLEKGLTATPIGRSPKEMDLVETRKFNRNAITTILGVPMSMMTSEDVNLANAEVGERIFAKDTIDPEMNLIVSTFNEFLVPEFGDNLELDYVSPIPEDMVQKVNVASADEGRWL